MCGSGAATDACTLILAFAIKTNTDLNWHPCVTK